MKVVFKIASLVFFIFFITILILSYGITTSKFNNKIINKIQKKIPNSKVNFKNASISLDLFSFSVKTEINNPKIKVDDQDISIKSFMIFTDIKSSFQEKYLLKKIKIIFDKNKISKLKNISLIKNIKALKEIKFIEGNGFGELIIDQFQNNKTNTVFRGELSNVVIAINSDLPLIKRINGKISYSEDKILLSEVIGNFGDFDLMSRELIYFFNKKLLSGAINLKGQLQPTTDLEKILPKKISANFKKFSNIGGKVALDANLKIYFTNNYNIKNNESTFNVSTENLKFKLKNKNNDYIIENINLFFNFNHRGKISSKGHFEINNNKNKFEIIRQNSKKPVKIKTSGTINIQKTFFNTFDFPIKNEVNYSSETLLQNLQQFNTKLQFKLDSSEIDFSFFNYIKKKGEPSKLELNLFKDKNFIKFKNIIFTSNKEKINIQSLFFNTKKFAFQDIGNVNVKVGDKNKFKIIKNKNNYKITGSAIDLSKYLVIKKKKLSNLKFELNGNFQIKLKKVYLPGEYLIDYENSVQVIQGKIIKLNSFANFKDLTSFSHKVLNNESGNKLMLINSDKAKPFLSSYQFLKGLEKGTLNVKREYLTNNSSITEVKIENFYLKEMPVLTKILSIASLSGALDILEGKGIFFKEAYLKYQLVNNELQILECYGTGPSLGFVLEGRIRKDNFTSLNGSLAPANTINNIVREIPVVGKILTGKKGDGIFGASFKIKGKNNFRVEVNPIKTLTPRFIQRFLKIFKK